MNVEALITSVDLVVEAEKAGAQLRQVSGRWSGCCPIHRGDNRTAFSIFDDGRKQRWHCFSKDCGGGDVIDFVMKAYHKNFKQAVEYLGGGVLSDAETTQAAEERRRRAEEYAQQKRTEFQQALSQLRSAQLVEKYYQALTASETAQELWAARGIPVEYQAIWELGYCDKFAVTVDVGKWTTATLTIPIFGEGKNLLNIRHRLLNPFKPNDKYRPERTGFPAVPFIANPEQGYSLDRIIVVEGEIKSMVTYITLDDVKTQIIGIPGKSNFRRLVDRLKGHNVYICMDPDADEEAHDMARLVGARVITLRMKIDDAINADHLGKNGLNQLIKSARKAV